MAHTKIAVETQLALEAAGIKVLTTDEVMETAPVETKVHVTVGGIGGAQLALAQAQARRAETEDVKYAGSTAVHVSTSDKGFNRFMRRKGVLSGRQQRKLAKIERRQAKHDPE